MPAVGIQSSNPIEARADEIAAIVTQHASTWTSENARELAACIVALWRGLAEPLLTQLAESRRPCRYCGQPLYIVKTNSGHKIAYTRDGYDHVKDNCNA
jgi:hypothetical protein